MTEGIKALYSNLFPETEEYHYGKKKEMLSEAVGKDAPDMPLETQTA